MGMASEFWSKNTLNEGSIWRVITLIDVQERNTVFEGFTKLLEAVVADPRPCKGALKKSRLSRS